MCAITNTRSGSIGHHPDKALKLTFTEITPDAIVHLLEQTDTIGAFRCLHVLALKDPEY